MIVDVRTYTAKPGQLGPWLKFYEERAWQLQLKYLKNCLGFYTVDIGTINRAVHVWEYPDTGAREHMRGVMAQDPAWGPFVAKSGSFFVAQENRVMKPVPFWPAMKPMSEGPYGIVDKRTYLAEPGKLGEFYKVYETDGMATQTKHLGRCLGFYQSEIGAQHQIVHFWAYKDVADRDRRRTTMAADPAWQAYLGKSAHLFTHQESEVLKPVSFWKGLES